MGYNPNDCPEIRWGKANRNEEYDTRRQAPLAQRTKWNNTVSVSKHAGRHFETLSTCTETHVILANYNRFCQDMEDQIPIISPSSDNQYDGQQDHAASRA